MQVQLKNTIKKLMQVTIILRRKPLAEIHLRRKSNIIRIMKFIRRLSLLYKCKSKWSKIATLKLLLAPRLPTS